MSRISIICGLGYGDEGKGAFVNYLCTQSKNSLVIRHNAGQQCGHTVVHNNIRHVFSNFGSGTLQGIPTYWSKYCTVNPIGILKEGNVLNKKGIFPILFIDANAMITTPFDIWKNHSLEDKNHHGTVGVGFGTTIQRNEDNYHLYARDLRYPAIRDEKIRLLVENYYGYNNYSENIKVKKIIEEFKIACDNIIKSYIIVNNINDIYLHHVPTDNFDLIFEGGQGIMLDMKYGFFPHVTRSNTTSENALKIINDNNLKNELDTIVTYYITRAYQTRHGNGYMSNIGLDISYIKKNPDETNINDGFQGNFRKTVLDIDLLKYALDCDKYHNQYLDKRLVITCLDQVPEKFPVTMNGEQRTMNYKDISRYLGFYNNIYPYYSDEGYKDIIV